MVQHDEIEIVLDSTRAEDVDDDEEDEHRPSNEDMRTPNKVVRHTNKDIPSLDCFLQSDRFMYHKNHTTDQTECMNL